MSAAKPRITAAEYLAFERAAETRHEFVDGHILDMAGTSEEHSDIVTNVVGELRNRLRGSGCKAHANNLRVKVVATGGYVYPDITVVCGGSRLEDNHFDTLLNPTLIFEVLSPSTEAYDRGDKFAHYREIESLCEYVMISQDRFRVERYVRQEGGQWLLTVFHDAEGSVPLLSIGCDLPMSEIYYEVEFSTPTDERETAEDSR